MAGFRMFEHCKAVVFDLDNTLIVRRMTLRKLSYYVNRFYFKERPAEHEKIAAAFCECFQSGYTDLRECFSAFQERSRWRHSADYQEFQSMWDFYYPFCTCREPEASCVCELSRMGYRIGILTNGTAVLQQGKVDVAGFRDWFEFVIATREIGPDKPDPYPFFFFFDMMKLAPQEIVYVGDYPPNDIDAPRRVGMQTVWFSKYADWDDRFARADAEISSLSELKELFPALQNRVM